MKKIILLVVAVCFYACPAFAAFPTTGTSKDGYCFVPPYLTQNVKPNITILLDLSGSMQFPAYMAGTPYSNPNGIGYIYSTDARTLTGTEPYDPTSTSTRTGKYYGYFDNTKYYKYTSGSSYFEQNSSCTNTDLKGTVSGTNGSTSCLSGNLLNWIVTTRVDSVRKILTGGRVKSGTATTTSAVLESDGGASTFTDSNLKCKFTVSATNTASGTNSNTYSVTRKLAIDNQGNGASNACVLGTLGASFTNVLTPIEKVDGIVQGLYNSAVLQFAVFAETTGDIRVIKDKPKADYITAINSELAYGGTPTGTGLSEINNFYKQNNSMSTSNQTMALNKGSYTKDPYYDSDGASTPASVAVKCRKSFVLLISDGMWPTGTFTENTSTTPNTDDPVQYAYNMRTVDQRSDTGLADAQTVATYTVYAFGDGDYGRNSLIATAIFGGFEDKYGAHVTPPTATTAKDTWPYPFTAIPKDSRSKSTAVNYVPYALSKCNPAGTWDAECAEWDKNKTGLPYNFFEGSDGEALEASITKAVNDMLTRASSGTAASMLGNTDSSGAIMLQALFFPERQFADSTKAQWLGDIQAYWYYLDSTLNSSKLTLREDTVDDNKLKKTEDRIASFVFNGTETKVRLYEDANGDGVADPATPYVEENVDEVNALWRAGLILWSRMPSGTGSRTVYTNNLSTTTTSNNLMTFGTANLSLLQAKLDVPGTNIATDATNVINYTLGIDPPHVDLAAAEKDTALAGYRSRTVKVGSATHAWKLGDIINSTPRMISPNPLNTYNAIPPGGYRDTSYDKYISTLAYKNRGVAFVGGNDGMLHAFKVGKNIPGDSGYVSQVVNSTDLNGKNPVTATELGKELWSYVPKNVLPYLKHRGDTAYNGTNHLFYVDSTPTVIDASIAIVDKICSNNPLKGCSVATDCGTYTPSPSCDSISPTCTGSNCPKIDKSWRTVLIGSMGLGGATRNNGVACNGSTTNCVNTPIADIGYSSYFAMDVTDPTAPILLWEFASPLMGYSTVGPAVVRIKDSSESGTTQLNGKFYAVLASGPTGPVDTGLKQMKGLSDQPLRIFVLDLRTGDVVRTFSRETGTELAGMPTSTHTTVASMPDLAFGGTFSNSTIDTDKADATRAGNYSDDAIYLGYARKGVTGDTPAASIGKFAKGGVLRILTKNNPAPSNWAVSTVIDGVGPVTSAVAKLQDTHNTNLWLYFGSGRYYYKNGSVIDEDYTDQNEALYGIKDPCYTTSNTLDPSCSAAAVVVTDLKDQTTSTTALTTQPGWKINLGVEASPFKAKRVYTNPTATGNGVVFFTSFKPSADPCGYGGDTSIWAVGYADAGSVSGKNLKGQAMLQLATGELKQVDLSTAFTNSSNRETTTFKGPPSRDETQITSNANHSPSRKILHIMER
jgi:type IV pilus assembly protein PilY1